MRLRQKMFWGSAFLAVLPVVITIYFVNQRAADIGTQALQEKAQSHITSVRDSKKQQIEDYFKLVTDQMRFFARDPNTLQMMKGFRQTFPDFIHEAGGSGGAEEGPPDPDAEQGESLPIDQFREDLDIYYNDVFAEEYQLLNTDPVDNMASKLGMLDDNAVALQYYYIKENPNPLGTKEEYLGATDNSSYSRLHRKYHPILLDFMNRFVFSDIYLVDVDSGNIVYSAMKELDFATSLNDGGPYAESSTKPGEKSGIAQVFATISAATTPDEVALVDFSPYLPNYNTQAAFIAAPIFDGEKKIGVAIFQLPIDRINDIMTYNRAWRLDESGETGETIILASDFTMRNDSRAFVEEKESFMEMIEQTGGVSEGIISNIELKDTTVGLIEIKNFVTENAFTGTGVAGFELVDADYRGKEAFWSYAPINVPGLSWMVISSLDSDESLKQLKSLTTGIQNASYPIGGAVLLLGGLLGFVFSRQIARPIAHMEEVVVKVSEGDFTARAEIKTKDELATLAMAFNGLLDDRLTQLAKAEKENEMLNNSIIELLKASFQLSQRDLTVQVPVTEDVTGPLADAINQMATETSKVLLNVRKLAEDVAEATRHVKVQSDNVAKVAETERTVVATTMSELAAAAEAMNKIAEVAQSCNEIAAEATRTTQIALETVTGTVNGMGEIRETIHETEKRIKRLGERSQEISGIVDIINNIAERTHVLALNASMQAAAAGEAGRGFSVVADEVQRLAESSRNATSQISALVKNIQVETNDTIATMDKTIGQVVEGSRLAERAGEQMKETQDTTANLVKVVEQIAMASQQQARISNELREHALSIQSSTEETARQLDEQTVQTDRLVEYSRQLIESIRVFKLPG